MNIKYLFTVIIACFLLSCSKNKVSNSYVGTSWDLVAELSAENEEIERFEPTNESELIKFTSLNNVEISNSWCPNSTKRNASYSKNPNRITADCNPAKNYTYEIEGNFLYVFEDCVITCAKKYSRLIE